MLTEAVEKALNDQIQKELYSSYIYLSMAAYFEAENLPGAANWMRIQHDEEHAHAMKIFDFIVDRDGRVQLQAIDQPPLSFGSPLEVFEQALAHERKVSKSIHDLYALAVQENDYPTQSMLQWFINEQVEEEKSAGDIVAQIKMIQDSPAAMYMLDQEFAARTLSAGA
ncbi:MAG: ferritin [Caldilineales bacterium]